MHRGEATLPIQYIDVYAQKNIHSDIELLDSTKLKVNSKLNLKDGFDQFSILDQANVTISLIKELKSNNGNASNLKLCLKEVELTYNSPKEKYLLNVGGAWACPPTCKIFLIPLALTMPIINNFQ